MKIGEMRAMADSEAKKQLREMRTDLAKEKAVAAGGTRPENPGKTRGLRKNIARLLTVIKEKERAGKTGKEQQESQAKGEKQAAENKRETKGKKAIKKAKAKKGKKRTGKIIKSKRKKRTGKIIKSRKKKKIGKKEVKKA